MFKGRPFTSGVILWALRWYPAFPNSHRDLAAMLADHGSATDRTTLFRWVQAYAAGLEQRIRRHLRPCTGSWRVDETCIKVKGFWAYQCRAVDGLGQRDRHRTGQRTGRLNGWTQSCVRGFRNTHGIAVHADGEWAERGEVTLPEAARLLGLSTMTVLRQIRTGIIPAEQYRKGVPWVIKRRDVEDRRQSERARTDHKGSPSSSTAQQPSLFQRRSQMGVMTYDRGSYPCWPM